MKAFRILMVVVLMMFAVRGWAAEIPLSELPEGTVITQDDLLLTTDDPSGTPVSKKISLLNFLTSGGTLANGDVFYWDTTLKNLHLGTDNLIGWNSSGTFGKYSRHIHGNEAAQFWDASDHTKLFKIDPSLMTTGITATHQPRCSGTCITTTDVYPAGTYTFVDKTTAQTLTNKTLDYPAIKNQEVIEASNHTLTAAEVSNTIINNYGQSVTANNIQDFPTAAKGYSTLAVIGTVVNATYYFELRSASANIYADVGAGLVSGKTYVRATAQSIGAAMACMSFQTGAATWSWYCRASAGTWTTD